MNMIEYARTCFKTIEEMPFHDIDAAILSYISYLYIEENFANNFSSEGMPIADLMRAELFEKMCRALPFQEELTQLIFAVVSSPRYRNARIKCYRNELDAKIPLQFSAMVISFHDYLHCICFRGTDKTFVGWKEDVLLLKKQSAPCQMMSTNYLNGVVSKLEGDIYLTGHSKGGHLASYAAAHCDEEIRKRIIRVYNLDGPGFDLYEVNEPGMLAIKDRIIKFNPSESPIGKLMYDEAEPVIIDSEKHGFLSHDAFSWRIEGDKFMEKKASNNVLKKIANNINTWSVYATDDEISLFAEVFFGLFESSDFQTYDELAKNPINTIKLLRKSYSDTDPSQLKEMLRVLFEALRGVKKKKSSEEIDALEEFGIDWDHIDHLMNDVETRHFEKK